MRRESARARFKRGETLRLEVTADRSDTIHVHGYDAKLDIAAGQPAVLALKLTIPGVFEVELETSGVELIELEVR